MNSQPAALDKFDQFVNKLPDGTCVISKHLGSTSIKRVNISDGKIPLLAAAYLCRNKIANSIVKATDARPQHQPITQQQLDAWQKFSEAMEGRSLIQYENAMVITDEIIDALTTEADAFLSHPACKLAYEQFLLVCKLALDSRDQNEQ